MLAWLFVVGLPTISLANCAQPDGSPKNPVDHLICADEALSRLEIDLWATYEQTRSQVATSDQPFLEDEWTDWLAARAERCAHGAPPGWSDAQRRTCVWNSGARQLARLKDWPARGRVEMIAGVGNARPACLAALDRTNIAWSEWPEGAYRPHPAVPPGAHEPAWAPVPESPAIQFAHFDILNDGAARDVYSLASDPKVYGDRYHWFIVAAPGEEALIRERIVKIGDVDLGALAKGLRTATISDYPDNAWSEIFGAAREPATLQSLLIDATNTDLYRGRAAESRLLVIGGVTTIMAIDDDLLSALFRPGADGSLQALCWHAIIPARTLARIETASADVPCPDGIAAKPIAWQGPAYDGAHAAIDLAAWGGARIIAQRFGAPGAGYNDLSLLAGSVGESAAPEQNAWAPLDEINARYDAVELRMTDGGNYIAATNWLPLWRADHPLGTAYYRIVDDGLKLACTVSAETFLPPGYGTRP